MATPGSPHAQAPQSLLYEPNFHSGVGRCLCNQCVSGSALRHGMAAQTSRAAAWLLPAQSPTAPLPHPQGRCAQAKIVLDSISCLPLEHGMRSRKVEGSSQPDDKRFGSPAPHYCLFSSRLGPHLWLPNPPMPSFTVG